MNLKIGDTVRFLREKGGGKVTGIRKDGLILVEGEDSFEIPMLETELIVIPDKKDSSYKDVSKRIETERSSYPSEIVIQIELENRIIHLEHMVQKLIRRIEEIETANTLRRHTHTTNLIERVPIRSLEKSKDNIIEVDLHAHALLDCIKGLSSGEIKNYQIKVFREVMDKYSKERGRQIVFIHGNGDGVLRKAILTELKYSYKKCRHQDASFQQYGFGATMVTIE